MSTISIAMAASSSNQASKIVRSGHLLKRGKVNKAWKVRWCVLQDKKLFYFKSKDQIKPIDYIPLEQAVVRPTRENVGEEFCFEIVTKQRVFYMVAKSQSDMIEWMRALSANTVMNTENALIEQAEEMICTATYQKSKLEEETLLRAAV